MNLYEGLHQIAAQYGLNPAELISYANEDTAGGYDNGVGLWACGSLWSVEGQTLYALVRALKPKKVCEIGTHHGASATHIASALKANGGGTLYAVDVLAGAGAGVPDDLRQYIEFVYADGIAWLQATRYKFDLVYEDAIHSREQVRDIWQAALPRLRDGGFIVSHDAAHYIVGNDVRAGIADAGVTDALTLLMSPSDCGLGIWRKP